MENKLEKFDDVFCGYSKITKFINKLSSKSATILLTGNSGSGKSRLAKLIHENSPRKNQKFIEVHCTTLPHHLLESELFGHTKGAFTGATENKIGKVQASDKGTLFLDEIGELSLEGQAKLLRLIQDKVICKIGSNQDSYVDTRIILATNRDLKKMVEKNEFREDLYYRINMFECALPDLAGNKFQINRLIETFLKENSSNKEYKIDKELMSLLLNYAWPGNVRELKNVMERLCFLAEGEILNKRDLPEYINSEVSDSKRELDSVYVSPQKKNNEFITLKELEKRHILSVIKEEPNFDRAAQILGITKVTLWRKRKEYSEFLH